MLIIPFQAIKWFRDTGNHEYHELLIEQLPEFMSLSHDNRTLKFHPFSSSQYSSSIHATKYRCTAENEAGLISSPEIDLRAGIEITNKNNYFQKSLDFY